MNLLRRTAWIVAALFVLSGAANAQSNFYLKEGDRIVFYGDSITDQRLYTTFVETYVVTRFPRLKVSFVHSGWGGDRVHPGPGGHLSMAEALLRAWRAPAFVTAVEIDAANKRNVRADNTRIRATPVRGDSLAWEQTDNALPMPVDMGDPVVALAVHSSDFVEVLDQQPLKVTGLTSARYTLKIDGEEVGAFTKEQLAEGINLALLPTPMAKQAAQVHALTLRHNNIHFAQWRQVQVPLQNENSPNVQKALDALDALEAEIVKEQRAAAPPTAPPPAAVSPPPTASARAGCAVQRRLPAPSSGPSSAHTAL